jgi:hypothetical protein
MVLSPVPGSVEADEGEDGHDDDDQSDDVDDTVHSLNLLLDASCA